MVTARHEATLSGRRAEQPVLTVGDQWIRSDAIWELIRVEPDHYVFSAASNEEIHLAKDLALVRLKNFGRVSTFELTPPPRLEWPLQVGRRGEHRAILDAA